MLALQLTPQAVLDRALTSTQPLQTFLVTLDQIGGYKEDPLRKKSSLLALIGGAAGLASAYACIDMLVASLASELPRAAEVSIDGVPISRIFRTTDFGLLQSSYEGS